MPSLLNPHPLPTLCPPDTTKKFVKKYLKAQHFYSYDAASPDEDPVKRWIGREVKRFIEEADIHLPVLLRVASAPADVVEGLADLMNDEGEMVLDAEDDDSLRSASMSASVG